MTINLMSLARVAAAADVHSQTIRRWVREGRCPPPVRMGGPGSAVRFRQDEIVAWLSAKAAVREGVRHDT